MSCGLTSGLADRVGIQVSKEPIRLNKILDGEIRSCWKELQDDAVLSPYQLDNWLLTWSEIQSETKQNRHFFLCGYEGKKEVFLLPLLIETKLGVKICRWLGGKVQNVNGGLYNENWLRNCDQNTIKSIIKQIIDIVGRVDLFVFEKQPPEIGGASNPFLMIGRKYPHRDRLYTCKMADDFDAFERQKRSAGSRNRLRKKAKQLSESGGPVHVKRAADSVTLNKYLDAFFEQKAIAQKIGRLPNPFADDLIQKFLKTSSQLALNKTNGLHVYGLMAGERVCAVSMSIRNGPSNSGFASSYSEALKSYSPGKILEREILRLRHTEGVREFDFGLGDDVYKLEWTEPIDLYDNYYGETTLGSIVGILIVIKSRLLRLAKQSQLSRGLLKKIIILGNKSRFG